MSDQSLSGKTGLVTGASTGIGLGISHTLASKGCSLVLTGLCGPDDAEVLLGAFRSKYTGSFNFVYGDLRSTEETEKLARDVLEVYPKGIDILINNAGIPLRGPIETLSVSAWQDSLTVNLTAPFIFIKAFLPFMKANRYGRIVIMSSQMGIIAEKNKSNYCTVKAGLLGMCRAVALEGAEFGITCNPICPGFVDAPMCWSQVTKEAERKGVSFEQAKEEFALTRHPMKKLIPIQEVADLVTFLCGEGASCISGSPLSIDCANTVE